MTIIHTISSYDVFGPEKTVINEALALQKKGYKVIIVSIWPTAQSPFLDKVQKNGLAFHPIISKNKFDIKAVSRLIRFLQEVKCDLIHSHGYKADLISLIAAKTTRTPIITTIHGWTSENFKVRVYEKLQALSWRFFDRVICVSHFYKVKAMRMGVSSQKISVIHNGITADWHTSKQSLIRRGEFRKKYGIPPDHLTVGIIGRLSPEKGHRYFLEAAERLLSICAHISFVIIGDGSQRKTILDRLKRMQKKNHVYLIGHLDRIQEAYTGLDILVIPSLREGLPNVLLEALSLGKAVVATSVGGIPEVLENEKNGLLVRSADANALTSALSRLIQDPSLRLSLGRQGQRTILERFSFERRLCQVEGLYKEIVSRKRSCSLVA